MAFKDRNLDNLNEIIELYADSELKQILILDLANNKIQSLKGISKFTLSCLSLHDNKLTYIDEFPSTANYYLSSRRCSLNFSNNANLLSINKNALLNWNISLQQKEYGVERYTISSLTIEMNFTGCKKFNPECLCSFDFTNRFLGNLLFWLILDDGIDLPIHLKNLGFHQFSNEHTSKQGVTWRYLNMKERVIVPEKKNNCFIATATMGSYNHPTVIELRLFRDNWILEKKWGERFVAWYYHYGSIAAKSVEKSLALKKICYLLIIKPLVYLSRIVK